MSDGNASTERQVMWLNDSISRLQDVVSTCNRKIESLEEEIKVLWQEIRNRDHSRMYT